MPALCLYFQVHQPYRLSRYSIFSGAAPAVGSNCYFDSTLNAQISSRVAERCYLPTNQLLLRLLERYAGSFQLAFSLTGVCVEQLQKLAPTVLDSFSALASTGAVEFIAESYYHSLSAIYLRQEFIDQLALQTALVKRLTGQQPSTLRNTELIYDDRLGQLFADLGYRCVLAEGVSDVLDWRSPNFVYQVAGRQSKLLLRNYELSDDLAFRFADSTRWGGAPLSAEIFAKKLQATCSEAESKAESKAECVNIFIDYETFGEHHWQGSGIFEFLEALPEAVLSMPGWTFRTPAQLTAECSAREELHFGRTTSWADTARDLSAWAGNHMQQRALQDIYELADKVRSVGDPALLELWRKLQTSDHFYYMSTKFAGDASVHNYFNPFESPYLGFISYMNVLRDFKARYF
jgi:alpha-amylase